MSDVRSQTDNDHALKNFRPANLVLMDKADWWVKVERTGPDGYVVVGAYLDFRFHSNGCVWFDKYMLRDLPNDLVGLDDLERFGIDLDDAKGGA